MSSESLGSHSGSVFNESDNKWLSEIGIRPEGEKAAMPKPGNVYTPADNVTFLKLGIETTDTINKKKIDSPEFALHERTLPWGQTYRGRLAMRSVSRFVVGSLAYAFANIYVQQLFHGRKDMHGNLLPGEKGWDGHQPQMDWSQKGLKGKDLNPLKWTAWAVDKTLGVGIKSAVRQVTYAVTRDAARSEKAGQASVMFRRSQPWKYINPALGPEERGGFGLGPEMVKVTFDFASMSFFDYMTRYFISVFDPHSKTKWAANGHLNMKEGLKELGTNLRVALLYASGSDMFAALPYSYYCKFSRHMLNRLSPGFELDNNYGSFGGSARVKKNSSGQYEIVGNYNLEGILDFTGRFTFYNIITKFYRDLYANSSARWYNLRHGIKPEKSPDSPRGIWPRTKAFIKYSAVTTLKVSFFMIPAAFVFGVLRTPQGKHKGLLISPEVNPETGRKGMAIAEEDVLASDKEYVRSTETSKGDYSEEYSFGNKMYINGNTPPLHNKLTNFLGKRSFRMAGAYEKAYTKVTDFADEKLKIQIRTDPTQKAVQKWAEAAFAYTPYVMLYADVMSKWYDTSRSDFVLNGLVGSMADTAKAIGTFNGARVRASASNMRDWWRETCHAILKLPSPKYEPVIQELMKGDYQKSNLAYELYQGMYERRFEKREDKNIIAEDLLLQRAKSKEESPPSLGDWMPKVLMPAATGKEIPTAAPESPAHNAALANSVPADTAKLTAAANAEAMQQLKSMPTTTLHSVTAGNIAPQVAPENVGTR